MDRHIYIYTHLYILCIYIVKYIINTYNIYIYIHTYICLMVDRVYRLVCNGGAGGAPSCWIYRETMIGKKEFTEAKSLFGLGRSHVPEFPGP